MYRKVVAVWVSLLIMVSSIVILVEIADRVEAPTTHYVGGGGPGNYSKIQWAIDNASDGDTVFVYNGTYIENLNVNKTINLTGENKNNTIIDGKGTMNHIVTITADAVNITNITITGTIVGNTYAGIKMNDVTNCNILDINSSYNGLGIYLIDSPANFIRNSNISNNYFGIRLESSSVNNINHNELQYNKYGIHVTDSSDIIIIDNHFLNDGVSFYGSQLFHFNSHTIPDTNLINGKPLYYYKDQSSKIIDGVPVGQVILANCMDFNIMNLQINNTDIGIIIAFSTNITIDHNEIMDNNHAITIRYSSKNNVTNNTLSSNEWNGFHLDDLSEDNLIMNNNASFNKWVGIFILSPNNFIINNSVFSNTYSGIYLTDHSNQVSGNNVSGNGYGILLTGPSLRCEITNNKIYSNINVGIRVSAIFTVIMNNTIWNNKEGIHISKSNNVIYHNKFIENTNQAYDDSSNQWDNGYPSGGNYWNDYGGVDYLKGPDQDIPGKDGIGDTPYANIIGDAGAKDNYPLMEPNKTLENYSILELGWNLISIPMIQVEQNLTRVLGSIDGWYDAVQWYNTTDSNEFWKHNKIDKPLGNDLFELNETMSFWIHINKTGDTIFVYNGTQPTTNQTIQLYSGWNMVGYPSLTNHNRTVGLNNLDFGVDVNAIKWFDAATKTWHFIDQDDSFVPGRGYWVHSKVEAWWEVPL
jgi:parallel beta-helix repeat protein